MEKLMTLTYKSYPEEFWRQHLDEETFNVCRLKGTEAPGSGHYNKFSENGKYYCAGCGGDFPLFSSDSKFDSESGWPSFYEPFEGSLYLQIDPDDKLNMYRLYPRTEVLCNRCNAHLGHVFNDGSSLTGIRYCINSVALVFVPEGQEPIRSFDIPDIQRVKSISI